MARKKVPITLPGVDELFTSQDERDGSALAGVVDIPLSIIDPFPGHPFQVRDDEEMERLSESIAENGVLVPLMVRSSGPERYELVSGHRRARAAELAGLGSVPCIRAQPHRRRGDYSDGGLEPAEGDHPAERAGVRVLDAP